MVMMNVLKTIEQLVSSVRDKKDLVAQIETMVAPLMEATIRQNVVGTTRVLLSIMSFQLIQRDMAELFDETYEVLDSISFFQESISPSIWACFEATYLQFKAGTLDHLHGQFKI